MDILKQIVVEMDRKSVKNYKIFAGRASSLENRKDMLLFDLIRKMGEKYSEDEAFQKIYEGKDKNNFYQLKNRLIDDITTSIFLQERQEDEIMQTLYTTGLGIYYYNRNNYHLALYHFKKAEKKARKIENYGMLDMIYARLINISQEISSENPEYYLTRRKENTKMLNKMSELENILQAIEYRVKITQNLSSQAEILDLLKITIDNYTQDEELKDSPKLQFGIYKILSRKLWQNNDFEALEEYLIRAYQLFQEKKLFSRSNHDYNLEILSWIANALFKTKKYRQSLEYADILHQEMERYDKFLYDRYEFFYHNIRVINFSSINPQKAIELLLELTKGARLDKFHFQGVFIYLNLGILYYQQKDFRSALKYLSKLYAYDGYPSTENLVKLRIVLGELIMRYELNERDTLDYRLRQVIKDFKEQLESEEDCWEADFLRLLQKMIPGKEKGKSKIFKEDAMLLIEKIQKEKEGENMLFAYDTWLEEKLRRS